MTRFDGSCLLLCLMAMAGVLLDCSSGSHRPPPESYADAFCRVWWKHADGFRLSIELRDAGPGEKLSKQSASEVASSERGLAEDLAGIEAPSEIAALHAEIVESHRRVAQTWDNIGQALDQAAGDVSSAAVQDAFSALESVYQSGPTLPEEYQQAIQNNERCKVLEEEFFPPAE